LTLDRVLGDALTNFHCKLRLKIFFTTLGGAGEPTSPLATPVLGPIDKSPRMETGCQNQSIYTSGRTNLWQAFIIYTNVFLKRRGVDLFAITSSVFNRFCFLFHRWEQK